MSPDFSLRRAVSEDIPAAYGVFRRSIFDYLFRIGMVDEETAKNPPIADAWQRQARWIEHLWSTSAENWVAEDPAGRVIGWAMSIERDGHLELTHFFVEPGIQSKGLGRALITKAFPPDRGDHRAINATQDPRALSLYLRSGVYPVTTSVEVLLRPGQFDSDRGLSFQRLEASERAVSEIVALEKAVLGFARHTDIRFLLEGRPAWLALRDGAPVAYAFGVQPNPPGVTDFSPACGPMAALDPADMPALIDHVMGQAGDVNDFCMTVPFMNRLGLAHVLKRGGQIDPFYLMILSDQSTMKLDCYIHTSPAFIL
jgi:GNAT superfamily N-acetyltransferase